MRIWRTSGPSAPGRSGTSGTGAGGQQAALEGPGAAVRGAGLAGLEVERGDGGAELRPRSRARGTSRPPPGRGRRGSTRRAGTPWSAAAVRRAAPARRRGSSPARPARLAIGTGGALRGGAAADDHDRAVAHARHPAVEQVVRRSARRPASAGGSRRGGCGGRRRRSARGAGREPRQWTASRVPPGASAASIRRRPSRTRPGSSSRGSRRRRSSRRGPRASPRGGGARPARLGDALAGGARARSSAVGLKSTASRLLAARRQHRGEDADRAAQLQGAAGPLAAGAASVRRYLRLLVGAGRVVPGVGGLAREALEVLDRGAVVRARRGAHPRSSLSAPSRASSGSRRCWRRKVSRSRRARSRRPAVTNGCEPQAAAAVSRTLSRRGRSRPASRRSGRLRARRRRRRPRSAATRQPGVDGAARRLDPPRGQLRERLARRGGRRGRRAPRRRRRRPSRPSSRRCASRRGRTRARGRARPARRGPRRPARRGRRPGGSRRRAGRRPRYQPRSTSTVSSHSTRTRRGRGAVVVADHHQRRVDAAGARAEGLDAAQDEAAARPRRCAPAAPRPAPGRRPRRRAGGRRLRPCASSRSRSSGSAATSSRSTAFRWPSRMRADRGVGGGDPAQQLPLRRAPRPRRGRRRSSPSGRRPRRARRSASRGKRGSRSSAAAPRGDRGQSLVEQRRHREVQRRHLDPVGAARHASTPSQRRDAAPAAARRLAPPRAAARSARTVSAQPSRRAPGPSAVVHQDHVAVARARPGPQRGEHLPRRVAAPVVAVEAPAPEARGRARRRAGGSPRSRPPTAPARRAAARRAQPSIARPISTSVRLAPRSSSRVADVVDAVEADLVPGGRPSPRSARGGRARAARRRRRSRVAPRAPQLGQDARRSRPGPARRRR